MGVAGAGAMVVAGGVVRGDVLDVVERSDGLVVGTVYGVEIGVSSLSSVHARGARVVAVLSSILVKCRSSGVACLCTWKVLTATINAITV